MIYNPQLHGSQGLRDLISIWIPVVLGGAGVVTAFLPGTTPFLLGLTMGAICGLVCLYAQLFLLRSVRLCWLLATGFLLGYEGGALNTSIGLMRQHATLADMLGSLQSDLSSASALILWICAGFLVCGGLFEPPLSVRFDRIMPSDRWIVWAGIAVIAIAIIHGDLSLQGTSVGQGSRITPLGDLAYLFALVLPVSTLLLMRTRQSRWRWPYLALLLCEFAILIVLGRRVLIYGIAIAVMAATLAGIRLSFGKKVIAGLACALIVFIGVEGFFALRIMRWRTGESGALSLHEIKRTIDYFQSGEDTSITAGVADNVRDRTAIIGYFSDLFAATKHYDTLHGLDAWDSILLTIPSAFYPDKEFHMVGEEQIANPHFGMAITDNANSLMTAGLIDFGIFGAVLYPLLIAAFFRVILALIRKRVSEAAFVVGLAAFMTNIIQAEGSFAASVAFGRDVVILALAAAAVKLWTGLRRRERIGNRSGRALHAANSF